MKLLGISPLTHEWHARRKGAITATDVPKILGMSEWGTALEVWGRITGHLDLQKEDEEKKPWLEWGRRTEDMHRRWVADEAGVFISDSPGLVQHPEIPYLLATPDGLYGERDEAPTDLAGPLELPWLGVFETKAPSPWTSFDPKEGAPLAYQIQVQTQLAVCDLDEAILSSLHWPGPKWARVEKHDAFQERALGFVTAFWENYVLKDTPPPPTDRDIKVLERLFPEADGTVIRLGEVVAHDCRRWQEISEQLSALNKRTKVLETERGNHRARITAEIGTGTYGVLGDVIFKAAYVERDGYTVEPNKYRTFRTVKKITEE